MRQRIAHQIVRYRVLILILVLLAAAWSVTCISRTKINYDLTRYLSEDTMTRKALEVMEEEFGSSEQLRVMFTDLDDDTLADCVARLNAMPEILAAYHDPDTGVARQDGNVYQLVTLTLTDCDATALVKELRAMFPDAGTYCVGGSAAAQLDVQNSVGAEMPLVMAISIAVVLAVLLLTSHAWLEPLVLLLVLGVSIVINLGTHFIFKDVSFITFAVSAILQLALSIDYAIMLLHTYNGCRDEGLAPKEAMESALAQCFMRISSSALTTIAGLLALLFMSFTIGFDIGLALSKGILISMLCVFLLMPAVTLIFEKPLRRTRHKPLSLGGQRLARGICKVRKPLAAVLILAVAAGAALQGMNTYTFTDDSARGESKVIADVFGSSSPLALLIPGGTEDEDYESQRLLVEKLQAIQAGDQPAIGEISAMVTTGAEALRSYTAADVAELTGMSSLVINEFFSSRGFEGSVRADRLLEAVTDLADRLSAALRDSDDEKRFTAQDVAEITGFNSLKVGMFFGLKGLGSSATAQELTEALGIGGLTDSVGPLQSALEQASAAFHGPHYDRMLLELNITASDRNLNAVIDGIMEAVRDVYGDDFYITGIPMSTYDIGNAFQGDLLKVNLITFAAILLIVALSFRSLRLPLLLVFVIEGAIWITMGFSRLMGQPIFFISYLICVSIQMGATIDYGILLSDQYLNLRREQLPVADALATAMKKALPTILTSGVILITAGFIIGRICTVFYIADIGALLARGALISVLLVITLLPALLTLCDRWITKRLQGP